MTCRFPDVETLRTALALAVRAPSVHNSQPWRWRIGARSLHLYADPTRRMPGTDPDHRDLIVSCGATLHHCVVALAGLGWQAKIHRLPDPLAADHLAVLNLQRHRPAEVDRTLAAAIAHRRTDRRHYSDREVSPAHIALLGARAARCGVTMRVVPPLAELNTVVQQAVRAQLPYLLTAPAGRAIAGAAPADVTDAGDGIVLAFGTRDDDRLARLRAGETTSLMLLTATALGMAACPITEPLELADTRAAVRADLFDSHEYPQMLIRLGWAPEHAPPLPATPRREILG